MEELARIAKFISEHGTKGTPLLNLQDEALLETKLYRLLQSGQVRTDEEAAQALYGKSGQGSSYRMLKSRFRKKLYNHLHFVQLKEEEDAQLQSLRYECRTAMLEAYALELALELKGAYRMFERTLALARQAEEITLVVSCLENMLNLSYSINAPELFHELTNEIEKFLELEQGIKKASLLYNQSMMASQSTKLDPVELEEKLAETIVLLGDLWEKSGSSKIFSFLHKLTILHLEQKGDFAGIIDVLNRLETLVGEEKVNPLWVNEQYNSYIRVYALLQTGRYTEGIAAAEKGIAVVRPYSNNWFSFMENYVLLGLHGRQYKIAEKLLSEVVANNSFAKLTPFAQERWSLICRYFLLMAGASQVNLEAVLGASVSTIRKQKLGYNLALLILEALEELQRVLNRESLAERLRKYTVKYLKGPKLERPRLFLRLLQLAIGEPNLATVKQNGTKLLQKLQAAPKPSGVVAEAEIVPYEQLWEKTLNLLEQRAMMQQAQP